MYYGLLKEPDLNLQVDENEEQLDVDSEKPKVKKIESTLSHGFILPYDKKREKIFLSKTEQKKEKRRTYE